LKRLLVLDLDETLIHATETPHRPPDFQVFDYSVYRRPYLQQFLEVCAEHFEIGVWSSAGNEYVQRNVEAIFPDPRELRFVWGASRTSIRRTAPASHDMSEPHYVKPLKKLKRFGWSLDDILMIDDSPEKCVDNYGNAIYPSPYHGRAEDDELRYLAAYLLMLKDHPNIRRLEKRGWRGRVEPLPW
jgi:RNA polymerase II subunit A small phosphatase-like protein